MTNHNKVKEFYLGDYEGTLFPMDTCRVMIEYASKEISEYISNISDQTLKDYCFLPQETVYASKPKHHLRRTIKLDPVAEYYMYEMAYKNRNIFKKCNKPNRVNYGYRFYMGKPLPIHESYKSFTEKAEKLKKEYRYFVKFDISAYFNSIYHHDIAKWFSDQKPPQKDSLLLGQFMREINSGYSIDFLPHGLYPSKMLGSHFLSYIDHSEQIKCENMIRFMDDFMLFSDSKDVLIRDFQTIQKILGLKSLNLNSAKTVLFSENKYSIYDAVFDMKEQIMEKIHLSSGSGMDYEEYDDVVGELSDDEIEYLISLIDEDNATDLEASLIFDCIHEHKPDFYKYITSFLYRFPHLAKKIFHKCANISEYNELSMLVKDLLDSSPFLSEYQLFWLAKIVERYLIGTPLAGQILTLLYEHKNATNITKAKILEIPELRFGMPELREVHLKSGSSGWLAWASAIGMRNDSKQSKNHLIGYFSKVSNINRLIGDCVATL